MVEFPAGIGIDLVSVSRLRDMEERTRGAFCSGTFTPGELKEADESQDRWVYLAGRFAVKEAAFKALAPLLPEKHFDFRVVETRRREDGSPEIVCDGSLRTIMDKANVSNLLVSISNEDNFAVAVVQSTQQKCDI